MKKENPLYWFYNIPKDDLKDIVNSIDSFLFSSNLRFDITTLVLISEDNLFEIIKSRKLKFFEFDYTKLGENIFSFNLIKKIRGSKKKRKSRFLLFKHNIPNIYLIMTHVDFTKFRDDILSFLNKFYPKITRTFLNTSFIKNLLFNLEDNLKDVNLRITRISSRTRIVSEQAQKRIESDFKWTDISHKEEFRKVEDSDGWIKTLNFIFISSPSSEHKLLSKYRDTYCQISRDGYFRCNQQYSEFFKLIIEKIISKNIDDYKLFNNRQRIEKDNFITKPIAIKYNVDIFKQKDQIKKLIDVLDKIPLSTLSVYHSNPHLHCVLVDFRDGSSYDIWILSNNKITIIPQMRCSFAALEQLCNNIFMGIKEGIIEAI